MASRTGFQIVTINSYEILILGGITVPKANINQSKDLNLLDVRSGNVKQILPHNKRRVKPEGRIKKVKPGKVVYVEFEDLLELDYEMGRIR